MSVPECSLFFSAHDKELKGWKSLRTSTVVISLQVRPLAHLLVVHPHCKTDLPCTRVSSFSVFGWIGYQNFFGLRTPWIEKTERALNANPRNRLAQHLYLSRLRNGLSRPRLSF